jgi:hypothetical protein
MNKAVWIGATSVFAVAAALLLYQNAEQSRLQERLLADVHTLAAQQEQIRRTLSEARETASALDRTSLLIRDDFHVSDGMRNAIAEYYMAMGKMPATAAEAGMQPAGEYRGKTLKSAALIADGVIELTFDVNSGVDGGRIRLLPDLSHAQAMGLQWHCQTADYPLIKRAVPTCEYEPAAADAIAPQSAVKAPTVGS